MSCACCSCRKEPGIQPLSGLLFPGEAIEIAPGLELTRGKGDDEVSLTRLVRLPDGGVLRQAFPITGMQAGWLLRGLGRPS